VDKVVFAALLVPLLEGVYNGRHLLAVLEGHLVELEDNGGRLARGGEHRRRGGEVVVVLDEVLVVVLESVEVNLVVVGILVHVRNPVPAPLSGRGGNNGGRAGDRDGTAARALRRGELLGRRGDGCCSRGHGR
jgi:hypothetical protein